MASINSWKFPSNKNFPRGQIRPPSRKASRSQKLKTPIKNNQTFECFEWAEAIQRRNPENRKVQLLSEGYGASERHQNFAPNKCFNCLSRKNKTMFRANVTPRVHEGVLWNGTDIKHSLRGEAGKLSLFTKITIVAGWGVKSGIASQRTWKLLRCA